MSFARRMQTNCARPIARSSPDMPSVLIRIARLCVLHDTTCRNLSSPGMRAESLIPRAYILPKPNSHPCARHEVSHLRPLGLHRRALVKRHFVDPEAFLEVREEPDEGLSDRPGADDVNDVFHDALLAGLEVWWPLIVGFLL